MPQRIRRRYIAVKIDGNHPFNGKTLQDAVWNNMLRLFGEYGASQAELFLVEYDPERQQAIFCCSHKSLDLVKASIVATTKIGEEKTAIHILRVSGTLKSLRRKIQTIFL